MLVSCMFLSPLESAASETHDGSQLMQVGAQVMLLQNIDMQAEQRLVNGSRGVVIGWASPEVSNLFTLVKASKVPEMESTIEKSVGNGGDQN